MLLEIFHYATIVLFSLMVSSVSGLVITMLTYYSNVNEEEQIKLGDLGLKLWKCLAISTVIFIPVCFIYIGLGSK